MQMIVAAAKNWAIGKDGDLLWHLPEDMKFFRKMTTGNVVVMGRKTLDSFPGGKPLNNRTNLVLTRDRSFHREGTLAVHDLEGALAALKAYEPEQIFIAGGGDIYRQFLPLCDTAYVTRVDRDFSADTYFPDLDKNPEWELSYEGEQMEWEGLIFAHTTYKRRP